jgi:hypothetical protein
LLTEADAKVPDMETIPAALNFLRPIVDPPDAELESVPTFSLSLSFLFFPFHLLYPSSNFRHCPIAVSSLLSKSC